MKSYLLLVYANLIAIFIALSDGRQHSSNLGHIGGGGGGGGIGGIGGGSNIGSGIGGSGKDNHVKTNDIEAVEGKSVTLPCPISAPLDDVYMVLWFRDTAGIPLYSFDVRNKQSTELPRHWSAPEVFGSRAKFHFDSSPSSLEIKDIKRHDQGIYRCRIDFRTSQTQSFRFNLSVIILPEQPVILDRWGRQLNGTQLGPKQEGDDIVITCRVVGGRPQPQVRWLVNGLLVDNQNEHDSGDVIENRLLWPSVQRTDLNSVFTCQAINTNLDKPKEKTFLLDMHLKPLTVKIVDAPNSMVADRRYEVDCESTGSRPNAIITWYKGKRQLRRTKDDILNNTTRSELSFVPTTDDDGKSITCRSENPNVNGLYLETSWKLNVVYPPLVTLRLGSTLSPDDIKEGDDVYFECHVQSNPQWRKLLWLHNGIHLEHNTSARVIRSNQSLVLQKITKHYAGNYACSAINDEGETVSNHLPLRVKYTPICKHSDRVVLIGASKDETVEVACEIQADPPPRTFRWKFNNSGETLDVGSERFSVNGSRSILKYTPVTDQDYGTLSCWAVNEVGTQHHPCLFQVVLAGLPSVVSNCSLFNRTELSVDIQCIPGYDGGLPQVFVLEMFSTKTGSTRINLTNAEEPLFELENLDSLTSMMTTENNSLKIRIYAVNQKGRSHGYLINDFVIGSLPYKTDNDVSLTLSPVLVGSVLTVVVISLAIALRIFLVTFLQNIRRKRQQGIKATGGSVVVQSVDGFKKSGNMEKPRWQHTDIKTKSSPDDLVEDERDPDVIPAQYAGTGIGTTATDHHFTPPSVGKWSPNSNVHAAATPMFDTVLQATMANGPGLPVTYNQINTRSHLMSSNIIGSPNGTTTTTTTAIGMLNPISGGGLSGGHHHHHQQQQLHNNILVSPTSSLSTATIASTTTGIQLPPLPLPSSSMSSSMSSSSTGTVTNVIQNALAMGHHLNGSNNTNNSPTAATYIGGTLPHPGKIGNSNSPSTRILHHTLGRTNNHHLNSPSQSKTTTILGLGTSSTDLDDNININAIKDCLMTQRVPESCV